MNIRLRFGGSRTAGISRAVLFITGSIVLTTASAQTWNYNVNTEGGATLGYITLQQEDAKPVLRMFGRLNNCWGRQALKADVAKTAAHTTITVEPAMFGCEEIRFVIKNDGTGGVRQVRRGGEWVDDGVDRGLTLRK